MDPFEKLQKAMVDGFISGLTGKPLPAIYRNKYRDKTTSITNKDVVEKSTIEILYHPSEKIFTATVDGFTKRVKRRRDLIRDLKKKGFTKFTFDPDAPSGD